MADAGYRRYHGSYALYNGRVRELLLQAARCREAREKRRGQATANVSEVVASVITRITYAAMQDACRSQHPIARHIRDVTAEEITERYAASRAATSYECYVV